MCSLDCPDCIEDGESDSYVVTIRDLEPGTVYTFEADQNSSPENLSVLTGNLKFHF